MPALMLSSVYSGSTTSCFCWLRMWSRMKGTAPRSRIASAVTRGKLVVTYHSLLK